MDSDLWQSFPHLVNSRPKGQWFETGQWCLTDWARQQQVKVMQVTWDSASDIEDAHNPVEQGIYRRNRQTAMLVWDKHTDIFRDASNEERARLQRMCFEPG
jgi:hypothetical protein